MSISVYATTFCDVRVNQMQTRRVSHDNMRGTVTNYDATPAVTRRHDVASLVNEMVQARIILRHRFSRRGRREVGFVVGVLRCLAGIVLVLCDDPEVSCVVYCYVLSGPRTPVSWLHVASVASNLNDKPPVR